MKKESGLARRVHIGVLVVLQSVMAAELAFLLAGGRWQHAFLVAAIMAGTLVPYVLRNWLPVEIPSEVQLLAILFVFATLFLGEVHDYYERLWWWDLALHATAGLLLGLLGFLIAYLLNESSFARRQMSPGFVALFAFVFALAIGNIWEIFEFAMDRTFGLQMQKPTLGDPSGLSDTMWDLVVNALGAAVISIAGWGYIRKARRRRVDTWVARFVRRNRSWRRRRQRHRPV